MSPAPRRRTFVAALSGLALFFTLPGLVFAGYPWGFPSGPDSGNHQKEVLIAKGGGGGGGGAGGGGGGGGGAGGGGGGGGGAGGGGGGGAGGGGGGGAGGAGGSGAAGGAGGGAAGAGGAGGVGASGAAGGAGAAGGSGAAAGGGGAAAGVSGGDGAGGGPAGGGSVGSGGLSGGESAMGPSLTASPVSSSTAWTESLEQAKVDLAAREFGRALLRAETVLRQNAPPGVRAGALLLAADSAYGLRAYTRASERYGEFLSMYDLAAEAPQATLALGWAELRLGQVDRARATWAQLARRYPRDGRAPLALLLAAEAANQAGDDRAAKAQIDLLLERYPSSPVAGAARLSRVVLAARQAREEDAARDLRELVQANHACAAQTRRTLLKILTGPGREEPLVRPSHLDCARPTEAAAPLERFAAPLLGGVGDAETTPLVLRGLVGLAAADGLWAEARTLLTRLIDGYQAYPGTSELLTRVAARAAAHHQWPVARDLYVLRARYHDAPLDPRAGIEFAEALFHTGALDAARAELGRIGEDSGDPQQTPRALFLLAEVTEALGHSRDALAVYERLARDYPGTERASDSLLPRARLLQDMGRTREARPLLEAFVQGADGEPFAEAAFRLAQIRAAGGEPAAAVRWYLTAAATGTTSRWGPRALLGAVQCLAGSGDRAFAEAIYRRLLASDAVEPELLAHARQAIQSVRDTSSHGH